MTLSQKRASGIQYPAPRIDAHQHFWRYDPARDRWITDEMKILKQDFLPHHLAPMLKENKIDGCIAVQADQSEKETTFLLALANQRSFIRGVVGWVDLCSDKIAERLDFFSQFKKLKGVRHVIQSEPAGFMCRQQFLFGIEQLKKYDFTYDVLVYHYQLEEAIDFVRRFPHQRFVIDHLAKPDIRQNEYGSWSKKIKQLASMENVFCKLSGFTTEANWKNWKQPDFMPYFDFALQHFGARRLLYGSDWPVCLLASTYKSQFSLVQEFISKLSASEKEQIMGGNAIHFYNL